MHSEEEGKTSDVAKIMCMHKNYDYVIAPSEVTKNIFSLKVQNTPKNMQNYKKKTEYKRKTTQLIINFQNRMINI